MAKPRIFISSTFYDLRYLRDRLRSFVEGLGYEPVLSELGGVAYDPHKQLDESCYEEVRRSQVLVLVVGGRFGSPAGGGKKPDESHPATEAMYQQYVSVTEREWSCAVEAGIPVYALVESGVLWEYETYKKNRENESIKYSAVDSVNIFRLLDKLNQMDRNKAMAGFSGFDEMASWLRSQWAGLFGNYLSRQREDAPIRALEEQIGKLTDVVEAVKTYTETVFAKLMGKAEKTSAIQDTVENRLIEQSFERFKESGRAVALGRPKNLSALEVLKVLSRASSASEFFTELGFSQRFEAGDRCVYEWVPRAEGDGGYIYFGEPERSFKKLKRVYSGAGDVGAWRQQ